MVEVLKPVRLSEQVCEALKKLIIEERLRPGDKFYSEHQLIERLKVSRSSIREAVRILEATGWVTVRQGKGIFIANHPYQGLEAFQEWLRANEQGIVEHFEVRLLIDPKAAYYAAKRATKEDVDTLIGICEEFCQQAESASTEQMIKLDEQYHAAIAKSTHNRTLSVLMRTMTRLLHEGWISSLHVPGRIQKSVVEHRKVVEAIQAKDPKGAERAMKDHLTQALQEIRLAMRKGALK
ncbi:MAG: FadR/GntR family transcriptional regulator [Spirochaetales bacterium]